MRSLVICITSSFSISISSVHSCLVYLLILAVLKVCFRALENFESCLSIRLWFTVIRMIFCLRVFIRRKYWDKFCTAETLLAYFGVPQVLSSVCIDVVSLWYSLYSSIDTLIFVMFDSSSFYSRVNTLIFFCKWAFYFYWAPIKISVKLCAFLG